MICVQCGGTTQVTETEKHSVFVWRKRRCVKCSHCMYTHEIVVEGAQRNRTKKSKRLARRVTFEAAPAPTPKPERMPSPAAKSKPAPVPQPALTPQRNVRKIIEALQEERRYWQDDEYY